MRLDDLAGLGITVSAVMRFCLVAWAIYTAVCALKRRRRI
jgi:hypothetical protein